MKLLFSILFSIQILTAQTLINNLKPEINSSFGFGKINNKSNFSIDWSQQFYTKDENFAGANANTSITSSNLIYNRFYLNYLKMFNAHWYGSFTFQKQVGRYFFYNNNRRFSTGGISLGHKGKIDDLTFVKEIGIKINNQLPKPIKDIYINAKFEYLIKKGSENIAIASLIGKINWLGTTFDPNSDKIFATRAKDESFIKKVDQSLLKLNVDFILTSNMILNTNLNYFTEYYPTANAGYDKNNIKHYIFGVGWKYYFIKKDLLITDKVW